MRVDVAVVGAGITGLAAAVWLERDGGLENLAVLDREDRAGGKVQTLLEDGYVLEGGPQGFLDSSPDTLELAGATGLSSELVRAADRSADRFILRRGRLRRVPTSPIAFLASDILDLPGRLRVMAEPFGRRRPEGDESVFDFARRRIGRRAAEVLVDAMVTGVFAGDSRRLSLPATFPKMAAMEKEHGSLTRAMIARMRASRRGSGGGGGPAGPAGTLTTFRDGMQRLPDRIAAGLGERLRLGWRVDRLEAGRSGFRVGGPAGEIEARAVLLAIPAAATARLLARLAPAAVPHLDAMTTAPIAVHMASYRDRTGFSGPVDGFGFLVPGGEDVGVLGTLYCHSIFRGQAPTGRVLLRTLVGGARDPEGAHLPDDRLEERVAAALGDVLGAPRRHERRWIVRWAEGIAQYTLGHLERVAAIEAAAGDAGIEVAGSPYRGVSVNDCIRHGRDAARRIAARLAAG